MRASDDEIAARGEREFLRQKHEKAGRGREDWDRDHPRRRSARLLELNIVSNLYSNHVQKNIMTNGNKQLDSNHV